MLAPSRRTDCCATPRCTADNRGNNHEPAGGVDGCSPATYGGEITARWSSCGTNRRTGDQAQHGRPTWPSLHGPPTRMFGIHHARAGFSSSDGPNRIAMTWQRVCLTRQKCGTFSLLWVDGPTTFERHARAVVAANDWESRRARFRRTTAATCSDKRPILLSNIFATTR
jgi:hypothetical protein